MKLIIDKSIVVFLDKLYLRTLEMTNQDLIKKKIIKLINKIQNLYDIDLSGYYNVFIHKDNNYGIVIDMQKEDLEYLDYFNNQVELNIEIIEDSFIYKIEDPFNLNRSLLSKFNIYKNGSDLYLKAKGDISDIELGIILENGETIYGERANSILKKSKIIKV